MNKHIIQRISLAVIVNFRPEFRIYLSLDLPQRSIATDRAFVRTVTARRTFVGTVAAERAFVDPFVDRTFTAGFPDQRRTRQPLVFVYHGGVNTVTEIK